MAGIKDIINKKNSSSIGPKLHFEPQIFIR